ncbi:recombinase family protein [Faecalibacterium sp. 7]|uniref:recombinase family protein n=1 Tax=Faecalibacterium sp. 7 TaxID=3402017 RepID=UPI003C2F518D
MACHATIAASTATGQQERSISWPKLPTPLPSIPANPATPARAKVSEIRSTSAANISALTTAMPPRNMPLSLRTRAFSGGNLNRPDFKKMMTAAKDRKFKAIVVYRLDRISRNISDFSSLIEELGRLGIDFVSIRESFDTSSPMGRAMMYIASVFSQLERETIAERIRDNMHELAKTGRSFTRFSIKSILQNPVYLIADKDAYQYFVDNEAELFAPESGKRASPPS